MPTATNLMTARSLRADLPYRVEPDELDLEPQTEAEATPVTEPQAEPTASEIPPAAPLAAEPLPQAAPLTEAQVFADAAFLSRQLYEQLVKQHGEALTAAVDHDVLQLLERYRAIGTALVTVEYYSNAGTFFLESVLEGQGNSLYASISRLQTLQKQGNLPGLEKGMVWKSGYIRLSVPGCRPVLLMPTKPEAETGEE